MPRHHPASPALQDLSAPGSFIAEAFARLTPPETPFGPDDAWTHVYHDVSSFRLNALQGGLTLRHRPGGRLRVESYRNCPGGYRYYTVAQLQCGNSVLSTPTTWEVESKVAKTADGAPYLDSGQVKKAQVKNGLLTLKEGDSRRTLPLPGPYTCKWCLLDAVGRMPKRGARQVEFTLLDEYDEPCPGQRLSLRDKLKAKTRGGVIEVACYQHTGTATMPGVFYVDAAGRVLFYLAGMQLLALASADGRKTGYMR
jgi:hypothetical protein